MRCVDLSGTWMGLRDWLTARDVLVLPRLTGDWPMVRLDADLPADRPATATETAAVVERLRQIIDRFSVPVVYVGQAADPDGVTVRVMAGGILHELTLGTAGRPLYDDLEQMLAPAAG